MLTLSDVMATGWYAAASAGVRSTRAGGMVGYVGVPQGVELPIREVFFSSVGFAVGRRRSGTTCPT
jgi:threonine dehydrogenase-like Zn-dependent dehydrogenase